MTKKTRPKKESAEKYEECIEKANQQRFLLRLYITGMTPQSLRAIKNIKKVCEERLTSRYDLEVIDIYQSPKLAKEEQIVAAPTLVRILPQPLKRMIGDLSDEERVLLGLELLKNKI
ncbi:MAG: circadian clock KaiB family protein [Bdellovibrionia bacterium]